MSCTNVNAIALTPYQQCLVNASIAILFEYAAKRMIVYLEHTNQPFETPLFAKILKSTLLDDPIIVHLITLFDCGVNDKSLPTSVPPNIQQQILDCVHLIEWAEWAIPETCGYKVDKSHIFLIRGLMLASYPQLTCDELKQKFLRIYQICELCGADPTQDCDCPIINDSPIIDHVSFALPCSLGQQCEVCQAIETVDERFVQSNIGNHDLGALLIRSIPQMNS